jgi:hypothetical protein
MDETEDRIEAIQENIVAMKKNRNADNAANFRDELLTLSGYNVELAAIIHKDVAKFHEDTEKYVKSADRIAKATYVIAIVSLLIAGAAFYTSIKDSDRNSKQQTEIIQTLRDIDQRLQK